MKRLSFLLLAFAALAKPATAQHYGNNPAAGHYLNTRGIRLYYESYGTGEPLLLFHGNGGSISNFSNQIPFFSKYYHVIAIDSRAQGKSLDPGDSLSFEMIVDDFDALIDSLHLGACYVVGWSDGGIDALLLAIRHPDKVKEMAFTGANLWPDTTALVSFVMRDMEQEHEALMKRPQTPENKGKLKIVDLDLYQPHITLEQLHGIRCPTLVIGGDHDAIPTQHTVLIADNIDESDCWIVPNSGHSVPIFKKDAFNAQVQEFFTHPYRKIVGPARFQ